MPHDPAGFHGCSRIAMIGGLDANNTDSPSNLLCYRVGPRWDVSLGYRRFERNLDNAELSHDLERDGGVLVAAYSF